MDMYVYICCMFLTFYILIETYIMSFRWNYIESGGKIIKDMDRLAAFKEGLITWSKWVDSNAGNTKVFFQGISPTHYKYVLIISS